MMQQSGLSYDVAQKIVAAACAEAKKQGIAVTAVVVDRGGHVVASGRMDGVPYVTLEIARRKAVSAASFGAPSTALAEMAKSDPLLATALAAHSDLTVVPGGMPVTAGGAPVGGLGIAGAHYGQDQAIAQAAVA